MATAKLFSQAGKAKGTVDLPAGLFAQPVHRQALFEAVPGLDAVLGVNDRERIVEAVTAQRRFAGVAPHPRPGACGDDRGRFEQYRDEDQKSLTEYAAKYGADKALELAAKKSATLQLTIDNYRDQRAPAQGDVEAAEAVYRKIWPNAPEDETVKADISLIADALSAARRAERETLRTEKEEKV